MRRENTMDTINSLDGEFQMQEIILDPFVVSSLENQTENNQQQIIEIEKRLSLTEYMNKHSQMIIEMLISVSLHIFIMAIFEVYFYFNYVVIIEKKMFLEKIYQYTDEFLIFYNNNNNNNRAILMLLFPKKETTLFVTELYKEYKNAQHEQNKLLNELLLKSYKIIVIITSILIVCLTTGLYNYRYRLKWKKIFAENILMFLCLGVFEYIFFMNVMMKYSPITDAEIKYIITKELTSPFISNSSSIYSSHRIHFA